MPLGTSLLVTLAVAARLAAPTIPAPAGAVSHGAGSHGAAPRPVTVTLTPADAKVLVEEALAPDPAHPSSVRVRVDSLYGVGERVRMTGAAETGPLTCALRLDGRPALLSNRITLDELHIETDGWQCQMVLGVARAYITDALQQRPWNLNRRLARASRDTALAGPRLPGGACVREDQLELTAIGVRAPNLRVDVLVHDRPSGAGCP
jgi:hypothetical protein